MAAEIKSGTVLDRIVEARRAAIAHRKKSVPETVLRFGVKQAQPLRDFGAALGRDSLNVIAELKKAFPSPLPPRAPVKDHGAMLSDVSRIELAAGRLM